MNNSILAFNTAIEGNNFGGRRDIGAFEAQASLGVSKPSLSLEKIVLYPNPSNGEIVQLNIPNSTSGRTRISIYELGSGKLIASQAGKSGKNTLKTDGFSAGMYLVRVISEAKRETLKMMISQ
ncbi:MAG TPA: T9SS type A sorting domain-containing protein [Leeuwenhoekiella sp.]|nr:T9SS type A sorting domain-containing protein [Leeuwenhoekiella sp.]